MRTLELNKVEVWYVETMGEVDLLDEDGYFTGEKEFGFSTPKKIRLSLYPGNGVIGEQLFGTTSNLDMISVSESNLLSKNGLLFYTKPNSDYDTTYDLKVNKILKSLNSYNYGLKGRM